VMPRLHDSPTYFAFLLLGILIGQFNLIAAWAALTRGGLLQNILWNSLLVIGMWYALILGIRLETFIRSGEAVNLGLILLAAVLVAQLPLWVAARTFRWRLIPPETPQTTDRQARLRDELRFDLSQLLTAMGSLCVAMGLGRIILPEGPLEIADLQWQIMVILLPVVVGVNLVIVAPCIWGAFVSLEKLIPRTLVWLAYVVVVSLLEAFGLTIVGINNPRVSQKLLLMLIMNIVQCVCVVGTLLVLRWVGFRLVRVNADGQVPT